MQTQQLLSLVDYLAHMALNLMDDSGRWRVYCALECVPVEAYLPKEWNDALCCVARRFPQTTSKKARMKRMEFLS